MRLKVLFLLFWLASLPCLGKGGHLRLDGVVTAIQGNTITVGDARRGPCLVVLQPTTRFKNGSRASLTKGDRARVEGVALRDGRILALSFDVRVQKKHRPALILTNLNRDGPVPHYFNVQGQTSPESVVLVTVRSLQTNQLTKYQGWSNQVGHFDVPVQASTQTRGERMEVTVEAHDAKGVSSESVTVQLVRQ